MGNEQPDGADALLRAGIAAARSGQRERARDLLVRALKQDRQNALAWLWLSGVVDRPDEQRYCLKMVLALDPDNQAARRGLALLEGGRREPTPASAEPTVSGEPQRLPARSPDTRQQRRRISKRAVALGVLGVVLLIVGLLAIRPSLASYVASRMPFSSATATVASPSVVSGTGDAATATPTPLPSEAALPHGGSVEREQVEAGAAATYTGHSPSTPTVSPTATPPPTATPTPIVYPPTRIVIPSIGVDAPVVLAKSRITDTGGIEHMTWDVPEASSAGWHEGSATLGVIGNTVINGHNWPQDAVFRDLHLVQAGEPITLYSGDTPFFYTVAEVLLLHEAGEPWEVRQANARYIQATADERVTVFTCYPYGSVQNRLIVIARPATSAPAAENE